MGLADRDYYREHHTSKASTSKSKYSYTYKSSKSTKSSSKSGKTINPLKKLKVKIKKLFTKKNLLIIFLIAVAFYVGSNQSYIVNMDFNSVINNTFEDDGIDEKYLNIVGADGENIILKNYDNATNPTYNELKRFLLNDDTEDHEYDLDTFVCADFAEMLHNRSEKAGIKAGFVSVDFSNAYMNMAENGHALVVYNTTDKGLVFVDDTNGRNNKKESYDKIAYVVKDKDYGLVPQENVRYRDGLEYDYYLKYQRNKYNLRYDSLGVVENYNIYW